MKSLVSQWDAGVRAWYSTLPPELLQPDPSTSYFLASVTMLTYARLYACARALSIVLMRDLTHLGATTCIISSPVGF